MKMKWNLKAAAALLAASSLVSPAFANEGAVPKGVPRLDHVFLIVMENHGYSQIVGNPNSPFTNEYLKHVNVGANYFAVAHPSSTNYLEIAGGSNFGVLNDNSPAWHDTCSPNLATGVTSFDNTTPPNNLPICPIRGTGTEAATPALDFSNETSGPPGDVNIDGTLSFPAATNISGKSIGDQLAEFGKSWKSYQESLPASGAGLSSPAAYQTAIAPHAATPASSQVREFEHVANRALGGDLVYALYLPPGYDDSVRRYPVLYLLHGALGNHLEWLHSGYLQETLDAMIADGRVDRAEHERAQEPHALEPPGDCIDVPTGEVSLAWCQSIEDLFQEGPVPKITEVEATERSVLFKIELTDFYFVLASHHDLAQGLIYNVTEKKKQLA